MTRVFVAGATGNLGREVVMVLRERGYWVRGLTRDPRRVDALKQHTDEVFLGDALKPASLTAAMEGVDVVFSCLGASVNPGVRKSGGSFREIDYQGNKHLLDAAIGAGVKKFVYVSVFLAPGYDHVEYVRAHEDFVREIKASGLDYALVRPTGFFSVLGELVVMAKQGLPLPLFGDGTATSNSIDDRDLAGVCVDAIAGEDKEIDAGGPDTLTRKEVLELAFRVAHRPPRLMRVPLLLVKIMRAFVGLFDRRLSDLLEFIPAVSTTHCVAPCRGKRTLREFFEEVAQRSERP